MGTAITKAPAVHIRVRIIMDRRPYSAFSGEVGSQVLLPRNSAREISLKAGTAVYTKMAKIPMRTMIARTPLVKKKNRMADSLEPPRVFFFKKDLGAGATLSGLARFSSSVPQIFSLVQE